MVDLENPVNLRSSETVFLFGPTRFKDDPNDVLSRVAVSELRDGVLGRLVLLKEVWPREDFAACRAGEYVVSEREKRVIR